MVSIVKSNDIQTRVEEIFNSFSHLLGVGLSIAALVVLVVKAVHYGQATMVVSGAVYGASLIIMYMASSFYHITSSEHMKKKLKVLDHCSIYILIAGSYTPFALVSMHGGWGWSIFGVIWALAISGVIFKLFFTGRFDRISVSIYIFMGWMVMIAIRPLIHDVAFGGLVWLLLGGLSYTFGVVFYMLDSRYHFSHFLWHLCVLAGSVCQFFAVLLYVIK